MIGRAEDDGRGFGRQVQVAAMWALAEGPGLQMGQRPVIDQCDTDSSSDDLVKMGEDGWSGDEIKLKMWEWRPPRHLKA